MSSVHSDLTVLSTSIGEQTSPLRKCFEIRASLCSIFATALLSC